MKNKKLLAIALATVLSTTGCSNEYVSHEVEYTLVNIQDDQAFLYDGYMLHRGNNYYELTLYNDESVFFPQTSAVFTSHELAMDYVLMLVDEENVHYMSNAETEGYQLKKTK